MPEWEKWHIPECEVFCSLDELRIIDCPKLIGELPKQLSSLRRLEISRCDKLVLPNGRLSIFNEDIQPPSSLCELEISALKDLKELPTGLNKLTSLVCRGCVNLKLESESYLCGPTLQFLEICNCDSFKVGSLGSLPVLKDFKIYNCKSIEMLSIPPRGIGNQSSSLTSLQRIRIFRCNELMSFPEGGFPAPSLIEFCIYGCKKLRSLPERMESLIPSLEYLEISDCPEIMCFPDEGLPSSLKYLHIYECKKLMSSRIEWGLQRLPSLVLLGIDGIHEVESFPDEGWLLSCTLELLWFEKNIKNLNYSALLQLTNLKELSISDCPLFQSLPDEGLPTSLTKLQIDGCPLLQSLSNKRLPASLTELQIRNCPLLKPRLEWEKGQDWPKVAHIPCVKIDDELFP